MQINAVDHNNSDSQSEDIIFDSTGYEIHSIIESLQYYLNDTNGWIKLIVADNNVWVCIEGNYFFVFKNYLPKNVKGNGGLWN